MINLILDGYAKAPASTGVASVRGRQLADFGSPILSEIVQGAPNEEAAVFRHSCLAAAAVVAWLTSHGMAKASRSQRVEPQRRLIAGYAAQRLARSRPSRGLPPFGSSAVATRVASERRQLHEIQAQAGPDQCLKLLRSSRCDAKRTYGSGPEVDHSSPKNGVRGAGRQLDARIRSAGRANGADAGQSSGLKHGARAPSVERRAKSYVHAGKPVNGTVQFTVDNPQ